MRTLRRVAVLGAGTMGSRIAAHFANAGIPALLLDLAATAPIDRNAPAKKGIENAAKQKPAGFFSEEAMALITPGNFDDDLGKLADCDWILEAVTENLEIKRALWRKVGRLRRPDAILSTNTSGIPLQQISEGFSNEFRRNFLGTHFFNPPRYLHLTEVIPGAETDPDVVAFVSYFCDRRLGKGVVPCKDTPNFIANRIGSFYGATVHKNTIEGDYTIEEVDALTGPLIGVPKSASYRLLDIVGLDVWAFVAKNLYEAVPDDPWRERFLPPPFLDEMMRRGWLGDKTNQGFYKRTGKDRDIHAMDRKTFEYHPMNHVRFPGVDTARQIEDLPQRLRTLVASDDRAGSFLWKLFSDVFLYSAERIPEISDRIVEIDRAMRWGYGHQMGPFQLWDALGFEATVARLEKEGRTLPPSITAMLASGAKSFYRPADEEGTPRTQYFDLTANGYALLEDRPGIPVLAEMKRARGVVKKNSGASLIDLGDGVLCVEFHSKMNALGDDAVTMIHAGIEETDKNFEAMVLANQGENFSVGANLMLLLLAAQEGDWDDLNLAIQRFQQCSMALKYAPKPVIAAPFARVLGGGCEFVLHCTRAQASAELYMGLVEVGVGLIPAGGGCKEMLIRLRDPRKVFELIGYGKVSTSAEEARKLGLLHNADVISMNPERLIGDAKALALALAPGYTAGTPRSDIKVSGESGFAMMKLGAWMMRQGEFISDHDLLIAEKLANVLSGGRLSGEQAVSEQYLLDLEREAFLSLLGTAKTQERIQHMLKTGKPLRN
ncbi:MAG TPA: 3-hydroxyacyl-CoA dehydrogenase NAD-binding domain-containing protein [Bryobacteraceae bacterium]|nr:3-hydroxyacyl-CoA dehydrogenase NAD-binding domain-containing protein [Bryobacteraceae bacterium]